MTGQNVKTIYNIIIYEVVRRICLQPMYKQSPFILHFGDNWNFLKNAKEHKYFTKKQLTEYYEQSLCKLVDSKINDNNLRSCVERIAKIIAKSANKQINDTLEKHGTISSFNMDLVIKNINYNIDMDYKTFFEKSAIVFLLANYRSVNIALTKFRQFLSQTKTSEPQYLNMIAKEYEDQTKFESVDESLLDEIINNNILC